MKSCINTKNELSLWNIIRYFYAFMHLDLDDDKLPSI